MILQQAKDLLIDAVDLLAQQIKVIQCVIAHDCS
jgi:hypothetical protein